MAIKLWDWEKKERTQMRYLKRGDIFCFTYDKQNCTLNVKANHWILSGKRA